MEFECKKCGNWKLFVQVSKYGRGTRKIEVPRYEKPRLENWTDSSSLIKNNPGFYCAQCDNFILKPFEKKEVRDEFQSLVELEPKEKIPVEELYQKITQKFLKQNQKIKNYLFRQSSEGNRDILDIELDKEMVLALHRIGLTPYNNRDSLKKLYLHQISAIKSIFQRKNVVIQTGTATGKSIVYLIAIINSILENSSSRALYISPTKALARDQMRMISEFDQDSRIKYDYSPYWEITLGLNRIGFGVYEGGMDESDKIKVRESAHIILTNPDMLHIGILPRHNYQFGHSGKEDWKIFFQNLKFIVVDEIHVYNGIFGSHVANILRRLLRICHHYNVKPIIICCSATIKNPKELAEKLVGAPFELINNDTAEKFKQLLILWNPAFDEIEQKRAIPQTEALNIVEYLLRNTKYENKPLRSISFCLSRREAGLLSYYLKDRFSTESKELAMITDYKASFTSESKRKIIQKIKSGEINAIFSTNALELGVDIGDLSICVIIGYPKSIASLHQQAGRVGRKAESISFLIARDNPLEQYFIEHPDEFLAKTPEKVIINPQNPFILKAHLEAAMYELPINIKNDSFYFGDIKGIISQLKSEYAFITHKSDDKVYWTAIQNFPAQKINIRNPLGKFNVTIKYKDKILGQLDNSSAIRDLFEGAIWFGPEGELYEVEKLDLNEKLATLKQLNNYPYYTKGLTKQQVTIKKEIESIHKNDVKISYGEITLTRSIDRYLKILFAQRNDRTNQFKERISEQTNITPHSESNETSGFWFQIPAIILKEWEEKLVDLQITSPDINEKIAGGIHGLEHLFCSFVPFYAICSQNDIGGFSILQRNADGYSTIFIYENIPGGMGLAYEGYLQFKSILLKSFERIKNCECTLIEGCPSCIQDPNCGNLNKPLDKSTTRYILQRLIQLILGDSEIQNKEKLEVEELKDLETQSKQNNLWNSINTQIKEIRTINNPAIVLDRLNELFQTTNDGMVAFAIGEEFEKMGKYIEALKFFDKAVELFPLLSYKNLAKSRENQVMRKLQEEEEVTIEKIILRTNAVKVTREFDYIGGLIRFKVKISNNSGGIISNIEIQLRMPEHLRLIRIAPEPYTKGDKAFIPNMQHNQSQSIDFYIEPLICGTAPVETLVVFQDALGKSHPDLREAKQIITKCPPIINPGEENIARVKNLIQSVLGAKQFKSFQLQHDPQRIFELLQEAIQSWAGKPVLEPLIRTKPAFRGEAYYFDLSKVPDPGLQNHQEQITIHLEVDTERNMAFITVACEKPETACGILTHIWELCEHRIAEAFGLHLKALWCPECGAPLSEIPKVGEKIVCRVCKTPFQSEVLSG